jgi:hypothetical protein
MRSVCTVLVLYYAILTEMRTRRVPISTRSLPVVVAAVIAVLLVVLQDLPCCANTAVLQTHSMCRQVLQ